MPITIPTALTLFRIGLLPVMVIVFYAPFRGANIAAAAIFILIKGENRRKPVSLPNFAAEKTFISNCFLEVTHARQERSNRTTTGR